MGEMRIQKTSRIEKEGKQCVSAKSPPSSMPAVRHDYDRRKTG